MESQDNPQDEAKSAAKDGPTRIDPRVGSTLADRYRIHSLLGEGGMGKVYAGEHVLMRKRVAIKVLHKELTNLTDVVRRFEREAMAAANIDHPNVAGATDFGKLPDGSVFLVLEYVQGISLRSEIADGAFGLVRALHVARQIASALAGAHVRGIVHRDLKPENVMLVEKAGDPDFVKVLDFGIAKVPIQEISERGSVRPGHVITKVGMIFGTPEYMAPEQALGQDVDGRADQYALGVILFEMLTGNRPYQSNNAVGMLGQQLQGPPPSVAERAPHVVMPPGIEELAGRLLSAERAKRFDNCQQVVDTIESLLFQLQPAALMRGSRPDASALPLAMLEAPPSTRNLVVEPISVELQPGEMGTGLRGLPRVMDGLHRGLPPSLQRLLTRFSAQLMVALLFGLAIGAFVVVLVVNTTTTRSADARRAKVASSPSIAPPLAIPTVFPKAPEVDLLMARGQGVANLERLAQKYPTDPTIIVEIGKVQLAGGDCGACLGSVARALVVDANVKNNAEVATLLWKSVQKRECVESAMKLLEGPMGTRGSDILFDLSMTQGVKKEIRTRAAEYFESGRYEPSSSPALVAVVKLKAAATCEERAQLLERSLVDGDDRLMPVLESMQKTDGCGEDKKQDCNPCLRQNDQVARAIQVLKARSTK